VGFMVPPGGIRNLLTERGDVVKGEGADWTRNLDADASTGGRERAQVCDRIRDT